MLSALLTPEVDGSSEAGRLFVEVAVVCAPEVDGTAAQIELFLCINHGKKKINESNLKLNPPSSNNE